MTICRRHIVRRPRQARAGSRERLTLRGALVARCEATIHDSAASGETSPADLIRGETGGRATTMLRIVSCAVLSLAIDLAGARAGARRGHEPPRRPRPPLQGSYRFERDGWIYVHLEGSPEQIGFQHGSLLADEIADFLRVIKPLPREVDQARLELLPRRRPRRCSGPAIDAEYRREIDGIVAGLESQGGQGRPLGPGRPQRQPGAALLLRPLARQERGQDADHARSRQLQRLHRHGELHQGRPDRHGAQRLDQLCRRHALEHHLRHQARRRARGSSWTACRA